MNTSDHLELVSPKGGPAGEEEVQKAFVSGQDGGKKELNLAVFLIFLPARDQHPLEKVLILWRIYRFAEPSHM